jgi:Ricin-type beta-trefoil lectin domain-like
VNTSSRVNWGLWFRRGRVGHRHQSCEERSWNAVTGLVREVLWRPTPPTSEQEANAANQIWSFVPVGSSFFIQSKLNSDLVIDVTGAKDAAGTPLQVWSKKPTGTTQEIESAINQLWSLVQVRYPQPPGGINLTEPGYFIQSALNSDLVIDVKGATDDPGTSLQLWSKKPTSTVEDLDNAKNQLWRPQAAVWIAPPK